mgnify:CR=1 FL=1
MTSEDDNRIYLPVLLQTQEKAHACAKFWEDLMEKRVVSYGNLTLLDLSMFEMQAQHGPNRMYKPRA